MKKLACCVAWVIALLCSHSSHAVLPYRQNIKLNEFGGEIQGSLEEDGTHATFYGVPYAQSPPTRFKAGVFTDRLIHCPKVRLGYHCK